MRSIFLVFCVLVVLCRPISANDTAATGDKLRFSISPFEARYCANTPIELRLTFENTTDADVLYVDPRACESCLSFNIKNSRHEPLQPKHVGDVIYQIYDAHLKLARFKPHGKIEFQRDITVQYFGQYKYTIDNEGLYHISANFYPHFRLVTKDGKEAYRKELHSPELAITVSNCK